MSKDVLTIIVITSILNVFRTASEPRSECTVCSQGTPRLNRVHAGRGRGLFAQINVVTIIVLTHLIC